MGNKTGTKKRNGKLYNLNNEKDIEIIRKRCAHAINVTPGHLPNRGDLGKELFVYVYTLWTQGKRNGATVKQLCIDFLRTKSGRFNDASIVNKEKHIEAMTVKKHLYYSTFKRMNSEGVPSEDREIPDYIDTVNEFNKIVEPLDKYERMLLIMKHVYDFTYREIGAMMGITDSSVHQTITDIQERVKVNYLESVHNEIIH